MRTHALTLALCSLLVAPALAQEAPPKGIEAITNGAEMRGDAAGGLQDLLGAIESDPGSPNACLCADLLSRYWELVPDGRARARKTLEKAYADKDLNGWARERYARQLVELRLADGEKDALKAINGKRGYVRHWLAMGPFGHSQRSILDEVFAPEVDLRAASFDPKARYETKKGMQAWSRVPVNPASMSPDVSRALRSVNGAIYLVTHVQSDEDKDVVVTYEGSSAKVFVNRALAGSVDRGRLRLDGVVRFAAKLHKGWNRIVVKTGEWGPSFALRLSTRTGDAIPDLKVDEALGGHEVTAEADATGDVKPSWCVSQLSKSEDPEHRALYGYALVTVGLGEEGLAAIEDPKVTGPLASKAWFQVLRAEATEQADNLTETERRDKAVKAYKAALKIDKGCVAARRRLAEFAIADDKTKEGLQGFESLLEENLKDDGTRLRYYNALMDKSYVRDAERALADIEKDLPGSTAALGARGRWAEAKSDRVSLQKVYDKELELDKRNLWVLEKRRELALARSDAPGAKAALDAELDAAYELEDGEADLRRAALARALDDRDGALKFLEKALEARPEDLNLREQLARGFAEKGDEASTKKALALLDDLLDVEPARVHAQNLRAALRDRRDLFWKEWEYDAKDLVATSPTPEKYPNAASVCLWDQTVTRIRKDGSSSEVIHETWKILDEDGIETKGKQRIEGDTMRIRVFTPSGEVLEPIRASGNFEMPGLAPGAVIEHEYKMEHGPPELQYTNGPWYLQDPELQEPFVHSRWVVIAPKDMNLEVIEKNLENAHCKKTVETRGDEVVRIWETLEQPRIEPEPLMPPKEEFLPWVKLYERRSFEDLAGTYRDRTIGLTQVTPSIKDKADELVKGLEGDTAKLNAIYSFVKEHVRQPEGGTTAAQILAAKGGSQGVLMAALLEAAGVPYAWAFAAPSPDVDQATDWEHPEPFQFEQPLLRVSPRDGAARWVNPHGARYAPMGLLGAGLWGSPVFICEGSSGTLDVLPRGDPASQASATSSTVTLTETGGVKAHVSEELRAAQYYNIKEVAKNLGKDQLKNQLAQLAARLFPTPRLKSWKLPGLEDPSVPFTIDLDIEAKNVILKSSDGTLTLPPLLPLAATMGMQDLKSAFGGRATRKYELVLASWLTSRNSLTLDLGPYAAPRLPSDVQAESKFGQYSLVFIREGGKVRIERNLTFFPRRVSPSEYKSFLGFIDKVDAAERRPIVVEPRAKSGSGEDDK
jgi:hypothetical protein